MHKTSHTSEKKHNRHREYRRGTGCSLTYEPFQSLSLTSKPDTFLMKNLCYASTNFCSLISDEGSTLKAWIFWRKIFCIWVRGFGFFRGGGGSTFLFWFCWFVLLGVFCNLYTNCFNASLQFQSRYASATFKKVLLIIDSIYKFSLQTLPILGRVLKNSYSRAVTTVLAI